MSDGLHRLGLVDTDGDGLLDDRLALQLHTELYQHVVSSSDIWMHAVYRMMNEGLSLPGGTAGGAGAGDAWGGDGGKEDVGLRQLPSLYVSFACRLSLFCLYSRSLLTHVRTSGMACRSQL